MSLVERIYDRLGRSSEGHADIPFNSLAEIDSDVRRIAAEILQVPYVATKEEFEKNYIADFVKSNEESDQRYQARLDRLNENRLLSAIDIHTERKVVFTIDPTQEILDEYSHLNYGIVNYDAYREIVGITSSLSLSYGEGESMPVYIAKLFRFAYDKKASDINITTTNTVCAITLKISGEWMPTIGSLPIVKKDTFIRALCAMSTSKPTYKSGVEMKFKINASVGGLELGFRAGIMPSGFGENISLRKLPGVGSIPNVNDLGFMQKPIEMMLKDIAYIEQPKHGCLILVTGQTGSGKTTLLATMIAELAKRRKKVCSSEDPIEILQTSPYINQTQVGDLENMNHFDALVGFLRQNPDAIVVGEIRDAQTLMTAIDGAARGHMVLATLHTASVEKTFMVVEGMGVEMSLFNSVIRSINSVTLISKLCNECKIQVGENKYTRKHAGCPACDNRGIYGVVPAGEFIRFPGISSERKRDIKFVAENKPQNYYSILENIEALVAEGLIDANFLNSEELEELLA